MADRNNAPELNTLKKQLQSRLWENIFEDNGGQPIVELEVNYPRPVGCGWIDVVVRVGDWFILIENKILAGSKTEGQVKEQYEGLQKVLQKREYEGDYKVLVLYLVPADGGEGGWSVSSSFYEELDKVQLRQGDQKSLVTWQPVDDTEEVPISIVGTIRAILSKESLGMMSPISVEVRQMLLSLVNFAMSGFQGYHYQKATSKREHGDRLPVSEILNLEGDYQIGIQYGRGGLVGTAWKNPDFLNNTLVVTEEDVESWQYLPLAEFKTITRWALKPEQETLQGIEWSEKPFWIENLYRVAKWGKSEFYVGLKGGLSTLEAMTAEQVENRKFWEVSSFQKNNQWISAELFCAAIEAKGFLFT